MTVISGEFWVKLPGESSFRAIGAGGVFEIPGKDAFEVKVSLPSAYLCEYL